jgi:hypothetical protein
VGAYEHNALRQSNEQLDDQEDNCRQTTLGRRKDKGQRGHADGSQEQGKEDHGLFIS